MDNNHGKRRNNKNKREKKRALELKYLANGQQNPKYVDVLYPDPPFEDYKYFLASIVQPEAILEQKNEYFFKEFIKGYNFSNYIQLTQDFMQFLSYKYSLKIDDLLKDYTDYITEQRDQLKIPLDVSDEYQTFLNINEDRLQKQFDTKNDFQTSTMGLKVSGVFRTKEECAEYAKKLQEHYGVLDRHCFDLCEMVPINVARQKAGDTIYMEEELNELMHDYEKNQQLAKQEFKQRIKDTNIKAVSENVKKAEMFGNVLTQTVNEDGELVGIGNSTVEQNLETKENISSADVYSELFEGDNIIVPDKKK